MSGPSYLDLISPSWLPAVPQLWLRYGAFARLEEDEAAHTRSMQLGDCCGHDRAASEDLIAVLRHVDVRANLEEGHFLEKGKAALVAFRHEVDLALAAWPE